MNQYHDLHTEEAHVMTQEIEVHRLTEIEVETDTMLVAAGVQAGVDHEKDLGAVANQQRKSCSRMWLLM